VKQSVRDQVVYFSSILTNLNLVVIMTDVRSVRFNSIKDQIVGLTVMIEGLKSKREVRMRGKSNLRVAAILNNAQIKAQILLRPLKGKDY
jgi:hypothetical protein